MTALGEIEGDIHEVSAVNLFVTPLTSKYERLIANAKKVPAVSTIVAYPCDASSVQGAAEAAETGIIIPILVGPAKTISLSHRAKRRHVGGRVGRARCLRV